MPDLAYLMAVAAEGDLGLGLGLLLDYRSRAVVALMAAFTLVSACAFCADFAEPHQMNHFPKNLAISGGLLHVSAYAAGDFALAALRARRSQTA